MKKTIFKLILLLLMGGCFQFHVSAQTEVKIPFTEAQYQTDINYLRARGVGTHAKQDVARKIAMLNAKAEIAAQVNDLIESVSQKFLEQTHSIIAQEYKTSFLEQTTSIVQQNLKGVRIIPGAEKLIQEDNGNYTYYVVMEYKKEELIEQPLATEVFNLIEENKQIDPKPIKIENPNRNNSTKNPDEIDCSKFSDPKARLDCDQKKFRKIFDKEMKDLDKN